MNAQRRKRLAKVEELLSEAGSLLEEIVSEEREALDNMAEARQSVARPCGCRGRPQTGCSRAAW